MTTIATNSSRRDGKRFVLQSAIGVLAGGLAVGFAWSTAGSSCQLTASVGTAPIPSATAWHRGNDEQRAAYMRAIASARAGLGMEVRDIIEWLGEPSISGATLSYLLAPGAGAGFVVGVTIDGIVTEATGSMSHQAALAGSQSPPLDELCRLWRSGTPAERRRALHWLGSQRQLLAGMSRDQVVSLLGPPSQTQRPALGYIAFRHYGGFDTLYFYIEDGRVDSVLHVPSADWTY